MELHAVSQFHRQRWMFAIVTETLLIAPKDTTQGHREWFGALGLDANATMKSAIRGFMRQGEVFSYTGEDFAVLAEQQQRLLHQWLPELRRIFNLPDNASVYSGMHPAKAGDVWQPLEKLL
jgi:hypothetical protein